MNDNIRIVCEGKDDREFIGQFTKHLELSDKPDKYFFRLKGVGGKSILLKSETYKDKLDLQVQSSQVEKVLFIFDADFQDDDKKCGGLEKSKQCIDKLIQDLNWDITVDYYIFDKNLDDFILNTLPNKQNFQSCEECFELKKINKNRKILTCIYSKLYPQKPYDFSHKNFDKLKQKLTNLFN